jgi:hypothetical protein
MNDRSAIQQIFASYADCEILNGEAVEDDDGTELQSAAWLCENRFDDFLDELSHALVEVDVSRVAVMRVILRHALRVLMENPDTLHAGEEERKNISLILGELFRNELGMIHRESRHP